MRILYFTRGYSVHDHRFLAKLAGTGHQVGYLRLEAGGDAQEDRPIPDGVHAIGWRDGRHRARLWDAPALRASLRRVLADFRPDLVHAGPVQRSAWLTAWTGYRPLVTMSWGSDLLVDAAAGMGRWAAAYTLARSAALVCDCQAVRQAAVDLGMADERIVVIPWGVDLRHFSPGASEIRSKLGWQSAFVLLSTRAWEPIYGVETLLEGFVSSAGSDPALRLLILGDGSRRAAVRGIVRRAGLEDRVHFAGRVGADELPAYYRAADLYVSASHSDGTSVSLLEAMACGLPALVSDIPGNREWVEPGENGWRFRDGRPQALAQAIAGARRQGAALPAIGARGRAVVERRADWDRNFPRLLEAYALALGRPAGRRPDG